MPKRGISLGLETWPEMQLVRRRPVIHITEPDRDWDNSEFADTLSGNAPGKSRIPIGLWAATYP